jgi:hypothetical protein
MWEVFNIVRRFLFGWANREFLIFLFYLAMAGIFWMLMTLNEGYDQEIKVPVRFVNVPGNVVLTSGENDTLRFTVHDKGISLITYLYKKERTPITIDFRRYDQQDGTGVVPSGDLLRLATAVLPASAKAVGVKPESLLFYYNNGERKKVPVEYQGKVVPDMPYYISEVKYHTDSVVIYASQDKLDSIKKVYTVPLNYSNFRDSLTVRAKLRHIEGVKIVPGEVGISFLTDMLTEMTIDDVPVVGENMPEGRVLRTFPAKLEVSFVAGVKRIKTLSAKDFLIVADYNELNTDSSAKCRVTLKEWPADLQRVRLTTDLVDYLIDEDK